MSEYPPKLVRVTETVVGSILALSDGRNVPIDIALTRLSQALTDHERPPLSELLADKSLGVYAANWETTGEQWLQISTRVLTSTVAAVAFGEVSSIWDVFGRSAAVVRELPQRVYGGLSQALYTVHPFQFRLDPNRPAPWMRGLLSAPGGLLFNIWVHLDSGEIDIEAEVLWGHYIE